MNIPAGLVHVVAAEANRALPFAVEAFVTAARERFGNGVAAVLFYGSCRRQDQPDGLYDLYVILDSYRKLPRTEAALAALLPPNVYYLEVDTQDGRRRAKCTVISAADFMRGTAAWFHSYLWGRFCQPVSLAFARDAAARANVLDCLARAVLTFCSRVACLQRDEFETETLWTDGLRTSYGSELRSEGPDRAAELFAAHAGFYAAATDAAAATLGFTAAGPNRWRQTVPAAAHRRGRFAWAVRRNTGKLLSLARILKAWITFDGGLDYIVWKLERHSGRHIDIPERVRRHPGLHVWGFFWRLYRAGVFR